MEIRGERHEDKIRFKGKDIETIFQMENLVHNTQKSHTDYVKNEDYEILFVENGTKYYSVQIENKKQLYFTYQGLIKVITKSRSGVAHHFMSWMKRIVFISHLGKEENKVALAYELTDTNPEVIKCILARCMSRMSCVYLFNIGKIIDMRKQNEGLKKYNKGSLYKIGRTKDLYDRTVKHCKDYGALKGNNLKLQYFSPV